MDNNLHLASEATQHAEPGEPASGVPLPHETDGEPPFAEVRWTAPSKLARLLTRGVVVTVSIAPTALLIWVLAPEELKYELRKQARWLPWAARYAAWWLKQEGW